MLYTARLFFAFSSVQVYTLVSVYVSIIDKFVYCYVFPHIPSRYTFMYPFPFITIYHMCSILRLYLANDINMSTPRTLARTLNEYNIISIMLQLLL